MIKGKVLTWDGRRVKDGVATHYNHAKTLVINGSYDGLPPMRVYSGSSNLTVGSVSSDEVTLRTIDDATTTQTEAWFSLVKAHSTRLTKVPTTTASAEADDAGELAGP